MTAPRSSLRPNTRSEIEAFGGADIIAGIPSFSCERTIEYTLSCVARGLEKYYADKKALILVSDGGSTDDTREIALSAETGEIAKIVAIYRGVAGKGSAFKQILEAADLLNAKAIAIFESDHKSIAPEWTRNIINPVINDGYDFVAPAYKRYKFDATITGTIAYNLTRSIYGANIRQPIGGDWGLSLPFARFLLSRDAWEKDAAKYGVDIWMTTRALVYNFKVAQARLGVKERRNKDPNDLSAMFYQVVGTLFSLMTTDYEYWINIDKTRDIELLGEYAGVEPSPFSVDKEALIDYFKNGFATFGALWRELLGEKAYLALEKLAARRENEPFRLPIDVWVKIVYRYAYNYGRQERQRNKLLSTLIPIYNARVASLIDALSDADIDASAYFEEQARAFEEAKPDLIAMWNGQNSGV
ncbi:MAG: glycosyltransferase [Helicobacteraceae bacterium]|jgi:glycosyltransferase involved in cell wall biosynthesis|nr:glycosyltransferase [Helicobacteraceae bacterium]